MSSVGPPTLTHLITSERAAARLERPPQDPSAEAKSQTRQWFEAEPLWFKSAVFYEIHLRGFFDKR